MFSFFIFSLLTTSSIKQSESES